MDDADYEYAWEQAVAELSELMNDGEWAPCMPDCTPCDQCVEAYMLDLLEAAADAHAEQMLEARDQRYWV